MQIKDLRILVVDDNVYKLMSIKRALEYNGVTMITTVNNQEDVFSELAIPGAHYDVIVTDMQYPLTSGSSVNCDAGYILIDRLKEQGKDIPVIICSSDNVVLRSCPYLSQTSSLKFSSCHSLSNHEFSTV